MTILCLPGGRVTFFCANALILFRTTSIPLARYQLTPTSEADEIQAPFIGRIQLQYTFFIRVSQQLVR
jgi:hypothetical protein